MFSIYGYYLGLKSLIGSIVEIMITFLVMFTALILVLWVIPFTWPAAALALAVWIPVAGLLIYVIVVEYSRNECFIKEGKCLKNLKNNLQNIIYHC